MLAPPPSFYLVRFRRYTSTDVIVPVRHAADAADAITKAAAYLTERDDRDFDARSGRIEQEPKATDVSWAADWPADQTYEEWEMNQRAEPPAIPQSSVWPPEPIDAVTRGLWERNAYAAPHMTHEKACEAIEAIARDGGFTEGGSDE